VSLTLRITNKSQPDEGGTLEFVRRNSGGMIGRSPTNDWCLPGDKRSGISKRHCEVRFKDGRYYLVDLGSTSGTYVNDSPDALAAPHPLSPGDRIFIGDYEIVASISGGAREAIDDEREAARAAAADEGSSWAGWEGASNAPPPPPQESNQAQEWWQPAEQRAGVSEWADRESEGELAASVDEIFGTLADDHQVDWASASWDAEIEESQDFAEPAPSTPDEFDPMGDDWSQDDTFAPLNNSPQRSAEPDLPTAWRPAETPDPAPQPAAEPVAPPPPVQTPKPTVRQPAQALPRSATAPPQNHAPDANPAPPPAAPAPPPVSDAAFQQLVRYMGVDPKKLSETPEQTAERTGKMLHRLVAGLMTLIEARARAKDQMGATATQLQFDGNNPLKFARNVEQALEMTLNPPLRGYMDADMAVEDAFRDLQAHQMATLKAMQGALQATLTRFSPQAIAARTEEKGGIAKLIPGQREAALWKAYEKEFGGVAQGSAEAFLEVFSSEFRRAYEEAARKR
jgi:type VI secretion system protein